MSKEVFGRPVKGDINHYTGQLPTQADPAEFMAALDELLAHPKVTKVRWSQYTPYFNDGEACEFGVNTAEVSLGVIANEEGETEEGRWYDEGEERFYGEYDLYTYEYNEDGRPNWDSKVYKVDGIDTKDVKEALVKFEAELTGKHYVWLNENFGDPAEVTATPDGFEVEHYEHE